MSAALRVGQCPGCGAQLEFKVGASRVAVCEFCKTVVARKGQDFSSIGTVADLIPTGSKLELGLHGRYDGHPFTIVGRVQLEWKSGVWDEWYASFDDGRWGWVAEAQGHYYVLFKVGSRPVPEREAVDAGQKVFFEGLGRFAVSDVKEAKLVACAGELPDEVAPGSVSLSADLEGAKSGFGTIDYGAPGDPTQIFLGKQAAIEELGLGPRTAAPTRGPRPTGDALRCPKCQGQVELRLPDQSQRVVCAYCGALLDISQGSLQLIQALQRYAVEPSIALGKKGTILGHELLVVGWMRRSCRVDGTDYPWHEFLLYQERDTSFFWLVEQDGHWSFVEPLSAGEIEQAHDVSYKNRRFKRFSEVQGEVEAVLGEFYWEVQQGDTAKLVDYVAPPNGVSYEKSGREVSWSYSTYLEPSVVETAFGTRSTVGLRRSGVGATQPWPLEDAFETASHWSVLGMGLVTLIFFAMAIGGESGSVVNESFGPGELTANAGDVPDSSGEAPPADAHTHSYLSQRFALPGREPLSVELTSNVSNSWASVGGAVIDEQTGDNAPFSLETEYYSGVEDGESWTEGSRSASADLSALPAGNYVLRADLMWDPKLTPPPVLKLTLTRGGVSPWQWLGAMALLALPFLLLFQRSSFEKERWWNSTESNPYSSGSDE